MVVRNMVNCPFAYGVTDAVLKKQEINNTWMKPNRCLSQDKTLAEETKDKIYTRNLHFCELGGAL